MRDILETTTCGEAGDEKDPGLRGHPLGVHSDFVADRELRKSAQKRPRKT
jgi:hypothetical protein